MVPVLAVGLVLLEQSASGTAELKTAARRWPRFLTSTTSRLDSALTTDDADAVQAAGDLVAAAAELAAGVQHGQHHLDRRLLLGRARVDRDAAAVVDHRTPAVGLEGDVDAVAVAGQRLVDRVVDDLLDQVVQAAVTGRADVHARALADRFEALEDLDGGRVVLDAFRGCGGSTALRRFSTAVSSDTRTLRTRAVGHRRRRALPHGEGPSWLPPETRRPSDSRQKAAFHAALPTGGSVEMPSGRERLVKVSEAAVQGWRWVPILRAAADRQLRLAPRQAAQP